MEREITEAELQRWFEDKANMKAIGNYIENAHELETIPKWQRQGMCESELARMEALDKARKVYDALENAQYLAGNRSIADKGHTQLRPDLIMVSQDAHYLLVELKTRKETERQAVQELLAYSAAMKMQLPFLNEFMFIIVARCWDTLLTFSVRSLIMDGKHVLPLALEFGADGEFRFRILHELFDIKFSVPYDPFYAMVPETLAVSLPREPDNWSLRHSLRQTKLDIQNYFRRMASRIEAECRRGNQSGFVMIWSDFENYQYECINLTVVTVNQFWKYSEHLSSDVVVTLNAPTSGVERVKQKVAQSLREKIFSRPSFSDEVLDELEEQFRSMEAYQAEARLYAQSSLSIDLLERNCDKEEEQRIEQTGFIQSFEFGGSGNLAVLLKCMSHSPVWIWRLSTYGDMADFLRIKSTAPVLSHLRFELFHKILEDFRASKSDEY